MGLLLLMAVMAADSARVLRNVGATSQALRKESRERDGLLDQLRTDIYQSGTIVRDYLLEQDDTRAASQKSELESVRRRMNETLDRYSAQLPELERDSFKDLRAHVDSYWQSLAPTLQWKPAARQFMRESFLRDVVIPRRSEVVELAKQVTALNDRVLDAGEERLQAVQAGFRRRISILSVVALILGGILVVVTSRRLRRLESEAEMRYREVEDARSELRKLSNLLVAAQEEERRNLSRELHDEIGQAMSAMLVELGRLEAAAPDGEAQRDRLSSVRRMAEESVGMIRNMALLLRPSMLDDLGLLPALKWQAREVTRRTNLRIKLVADEISDDLLDSHRTCVYRVVQEALNNCAKHSQATQVRVIVRQDPDGLSVSVQDDGVGFDPHQEKGLGLLGMQERVERLGGRFRIESESGQGSILSIRLPLADASPVSTKDTA